jgi:flagellar hook-basal body complex protein FliE
MVDGLNNLPSASSLTRLQGGLQQAGGAADASATDASGSFKDVLIKNLNEVNQLQNDADTTLNNYVAGNTKNVGEVISAGQKASMAFSMLVQIRNKLQDAYDEMKNLRV